MFDVSNKIYANPSSTHRLGHEASNVVEESRKRIAKILGVSASEVFFTSGATESNNIAILGMIRALKKKSDKPIHVITSQIEHASVYNCFKKLENEGIDVSYIPVDTNGVVRLDILEDCIQENTELVSIMHVNNETGSIQPIKDISKMLKKNRKIIFHVDGVQGIGKVHIPLDGIDLFTVSGHKIGGPKGVGILVVKEGVEILPIIFGGGQEHGVRSGTLNVPGIVGIAEAIQLNNFENKQKLHCLLEIHNLIYSELIKMPDIILNTPQFPLAAPHIINFSYPKTTAAIFLKLLSDQGIIASSQSACSAKKNEPSRVLVAMDRNEKIASSSIRVSFNESVTANEAKLLVEGIQSTIKEIEKIRGVGSVN
jgi:cysteine desulfurase